MQTLLQSSNDGSLTAIKLPSIQRSPTPLAGLRGPTSKGKKGGGKRKKGVGLEGKGKKGRDGGAEGKGRKKSRNTPTLIPASPPGLPTPMTR